MWICSAQLLTRSALLSAHRKNQLALHLSTGNCFVSGKSNAIGSWVATLVLKMLQLWLIYGEVSSLSRLCYSLHCSLPTQGGKKTPKPEKLSEVPYSASAGLLAFATGLISKFSSSVLEHLQKRLVRQSRRQILQLKDLQAFQCFTCTHT